VKGLKSGYYSNLAKNGDLSEGMSWHTLDIETVFKKLDGTAEGLSQQKAAARLKQYGPNNLIEQKKKSAWLLLLAQFKDFMILILIAASIVSAWIGEIADTIVILVIVIINAVVGFVQQYRAEKAMDALKQLATPHAQVLRDGQVQNVVTSDLVPGDIVLLEAGGVVPADMRLTETHGLRTIESSLTGESLAVDKQTAAMAEEDAPLGDRHNLAYKGTQVTFGRGTGVVVATGMETELGKIAGMLQMPEMQTPLQQRMTDFGKKLSYVILLLCLILFGIGLIRGQEPLSTLLVALSLAVAAIPEALPALMTIALARGAKRLARKNALIRQLPAVETLGSVTVICSDKTGTLTQNKMTVVEATAPNDSLRLRSDINLLETLIALNHDARKTSAGQRVGDATEVALVDYAEKKYGSANIDDIRKKFTRVAEMPFDADRKMMTTIHAFDGKFIAVVKGAAESIARNLTNEAETAELIQLTNRMASDGLRVLAYGYNILESLPDTVTAAEVEKDLTYAGIVGMMDPPREDVKESIAQCITAGIRPVMITGDHEQTATAIARKIGMLSADDLVLGGTALTKFTDQQLDEQIERIRVFARVSPEQKLKIVKSLQRKGHVVAMTGDGVNDAPSLKAADIGVAMGITGTDVSKQAADMILLDDNFTTIVKAIKEGRRIDDNIRKFIRYMLTCNGAEIITLLFAPLLGLPLPLLAVHILWINLVTDGLPALALSAEPAEPGVMQRPPRKPHESLFAENMVRYIAIVGVLMAALTWATQAISIRLGHPHWQTMVFSVLSLSQLAQALSVSHKAPIRLKNLFTNKTMFYSLFFTFLLQLLVIYLPFGNQWLKTVPLTPIELVCVIGVAAIAFVVVEIKKRVN
jgi:Ca2+-transporting ATPase